MLRFNSILHYLTKYIYEITGVWVGFYLTKYHNRFFVSEVQPQKRKKNKNDHQLQDNIADLIYIRSGLFTTDL